MNKLYQLDTDMLKDMRVSAVNKHLHSTIFAMSCLFLKSHLSVGL